MAGFGIVAKVAEEIAKPLMHRLTVLGLELVELPAKDQVFEFAMGADGASEEVASFENDGARERRLLCWLARQCCGESVGAPERGFSSLCDLPVLFVSPGRLRKPRKNEFSAQLLSAMTGIDRHGVTFEDTYQFTLKDQKYQRLGPLFRKVAKCIACARLD